jgi:hypothetical protein
MLRAEIGRFHCTADRDSWQPRDNFQVVVKGVRQMPTKQSQPRVMTMYNPLVFALRSVLFLPLFVTELAPLGGDVVAQQHVLRWDAEGTVIEITDPDMIFTNVQMGDPVRGFISYDLTTPPDDFDPNFVTYEHEPTFEVAGMVIENPRDGSEIRFVADSAGFPLVRIGNNQSAPGAVFDAVGASQQVLAPTGSFSLVPTVFADLLWPSDVLPDARLPAALELTESTLATLSFGDLLGVTFGLPYDIVARIHTLTPVLEPNTPGDFNGDGIVDDADYDAWKSNFGSTSDAAADGNGNGTVDAADYVVWRNAVSPAAASGSVAGLSAPEPSGAILSAIALGLMIARYTGSAARYARPGF